MKKPSTICAPRSICWKLESKPSCASHCSKNSPTLTTSLARASRPSPLYQEALELWRTLAGADKWSAVRLQRKTGGTDLEIFAFADRQRFEAVCRASFEAGLKLAEGEPPHPEQFAC